MAFGFPAHAEATRRFGDRAAAVQAMDAALQATGWRYTRVSDGVLEARRPVSWWSWGERVRCVVSVEGDLSIRSECLVRTQCIDWGVNRRNVDNLVRLLDGYLG